MNTNLIPGTRVGENGDGAGESERRIPVGTHFFRQLYLFAFAPQAEVLRHLRTQAIPEEQSRTESIIEAWKSAQLKVKSLMEQEGGLADTNADVQIPEVHVERLSEIATDSLFQKTFSGLPISFGLVDVDKLVAAQRTVNLDYVDRLVSTISSHPSLDELIEICLSPTRSMDPIQHLEVSPNTHTFTSPNSDIRFLGAFVKELTPQDLEYAVSGGLPAAAVITFVGYGGAPVNVLEVENRIVLNNGFHRAYALRSLGVNQLPVVIQHVDNAQLEFPPAVAGLPKEYLLGAGRPVLMKDFFEDDLTVPLRVRERLKMVTVGIGLNQHDVPA